MSDVEEYLRRKELGRHIWRFDIKKGRYVCEACGKVAETQKDLVN